MQNTDLYIIEYRRQYYNGDPIKLVKSLSKDLDDKKIDAVSDIYRYDPALRWEPLRIKATRMNFELAMEVVSILVRFVAAHNNLTGKTGFLTDEWALKIINTTDYQIEYSTDL